MVIIAIASLKGSAAAATIGFYDPSLRLWSHSEDYFEGEKKERGKNQYFFAFNQFFVKCEYKVAIIFFCSCIKTTLFIVTFTLMETRGFGAF